MHPMRLPLPLPLACAALTLAACGGPQRVMLDAPARDAPLAERLDAYARLRPRVIEETHTTHYRVTEHKGRYFTTHDTDKIGETMTTDAVQLADGQRVAVLDDLLPVVEPESDVARAVRAHAHHVELRDSRLNWTLLAGAGAVVGGLSTLAATDSAAAGGGVFLGLSGVTVWLAVSSAMHASYAEHQRAAAFGGFDGALRERLDLCEVQGAMGPCTAVERAPEARPPARDAMVHF